MINGIDKYIELPYTIVNDVIDTSLYGNTKVFSRFDGNRIIADEDRYNKVVSIIQEAMFKRRSIFDNHTENEIKDMSQEQFSKLVDEVNIANEGLPSGRVIKSLFAHLFLAYTLYYPSVKRYKDFAPHIVDISKLYADASVAYGAIERCDKIKVEISNGKMAGLSIHSESDRKIYYVDSSYFLLATYDLQEFGLDWMYNINDAEIIFNKTRRGEESEDFCRGKKWLRKTLYREDKISGGGSRSKLVRALGENFQGLYRFLLDNIDNLNLGNKKHTKETRIVDFIIKLFEIDGVNSTTLTNYCRRKPKSKIKL